MKFNGALLTALAALGSVNGAAIDKRAPDVNLQAAQITLRTSNGYRFPLERNVISFSVDTPGYYWFFIRAGSGGVGGNKTGPYTVGGGGAVVQGAYVLLPNERYLAVVGQKGGDGVGTTLPKVTIPEVSAGGGGGGSFVYHSDNTLLLAAGGGGGNNFDNFLQGRDGIQNDALIGNILGGKAVGGAGAGGAGYGTADETGFTGNGTDAGVISAKGGKTKASSAPWAGGAVDSRQAGAQGNGGYGGGGGGGKYSGGGGGGYSGGDGGRIPGNLGRPTEAGFGGTTFRRTAPYNGFDSKEAMYTGQTNIGDGEIAVFFRTDLGYPPTAA